MVGDAATPVEAIRAAIEARGPITFAEFMELALYGRGSFYETPPIGPRGDFVTREPTADEEQSMPRHVMEHEA